MKLDSQHELGHTGARERCDLRPILRLEQARAVLTLLAVCAGGLACQGETSHAASGAAAEVAFTEPIGLQIPAADGLPPVKIVLAFNRGATVSGLVEPVGSSVYKALKACRQVVDGLARGGDAVVAFSVEDGRISAETPSIDDESGTCLAAALGGDRMATPPGMALQVRARLMVPGAHRGTP
jgi:hypothetical protein